MDVTRKNFQTVLDGLDEELRAATFVAIDTEFTGLQDSSQSNKFFAFDTPAERYKKLRESSQQFLIIQFGLSVFRHEDGKFVSKTYNFYTFPDTGNSRNATPSQMFLSQASSLVFLANHGFDFNKLFKEGIPFLNLADEDKMRNNIEEKLSANSSPIAATSETPLPEIPEEQKSFMDNIFSNISAFLEKDHESDSAQLVIGDCNAFQRKLIFSHGRAKFVNAHFESKKTEKYERAMVIHKTSPESKQKLMEQTRLAEWAHFDSCLGFTKVLRKITESGKLVVGHNMLLDVMHIIHQFYADLPEDYNDFKVVANTIFPKLIDTKVMANTHVFREHLPNSALEILMKSLSKPPFEIGEVVVAPGTPSYSEDCSKAHEAGYDAYLTGLCFIGMSNYLGKLNSKALSTFHAESAFIVPFLQKINMMLSPEAPYMCLDGPDMEFPRDHIFHLTFPKDWKLQDIFQLFSVYGPVRVSWIGDTSAFVVLIKKENKHLVLKHISPPIGCTLMSFERFLAANEKSVSGVQDEQKPVAKPMVSSKKGKKRSRQDSSTENSQEKKVMPSNARFEVSQDWD